MIQQKTWSFTGGSLALCALWGAVLLLFLQILLHATIAEDAYITFRTVDQFVQGNGLRWNIDERVQVYTHPLWMFLHVPFYLVWDNIFFISIFIGMACTFMAVWLPIKTFNRPHATALVLLVLPLMASRSFVDYSTSGFENALLHALCGWVGWCLFRARETHFWFWLCLAVSLSLLTRLDTIILYAPVGFYLLYSKFRDIRWKQVLAGVSPIIGWELFSLFYYGFLFPNTKYAKLNTGISVPEYIWHGWHYFLNLVAVDMLAAVWLVVACLLSFVLAWRFYKTREYRTGLLSAVAFGILAYSSYVIYVGGYFAFGKFWSLSVYASVWLVYALVKAPSSRMLMIVVALVLSVKTLYPVVPEIRKGCTSCFFTVQMLDTSSETAQGWVRLSNYTQDKLYWLAFLVIFVGFLATRIRKPLYGVGVAAGAGTLIVVAVYTTFPSMEKLCPSCFDTVHMTSGDPKPVVGWVRFSDYLLDKRKLPVAHAKSPKDMQVAGSIGIYGFISANETIILDNIGLADPLLSRLPTIYSYLGKKGGIGRLKRDIPPGYLEARKTGDASQMDPNLAFYYQKLRLIVSGDLWDPQRLIEIGKFNLGWYDDALDAYTHTLKPKKRVDKKKKRARKKRKKHTQH